MQRRGKRPSEYASKSSHSHLIADDAIAEFLSNCDLPKLKADVPVQEHQLINFTAISPSRIKNVIAVDGGYRDIVVRKEFPSSQIAFFQFGALFFYISDLEDIEESPFIAPEDMSKLKNIERLKLVIPIKNVVSKNQSNLTDSVRKAIYDFCNADIDGGRLIHALKWLIFEEYNDHPVDSWVLATCPHCDEKKIDLQYKEISSDFTFVCDSCQGILYLTDVFRLHEAIDDELGAGGVLGYITTALEQLLIVFLIKSLLAIKPATLSQTLFIKDGPLAFFGQTANLHKPMRKLCLWLKQNHNLFLAGLEKSGAFVDHADEISDHIEKGQILILDNEYIYKYVTPGKINKSDLYGSSSYYSNKVIYKTSSGGMFVVSMPTPEGLFKPKKDDFHNFEEIMTSIQKLRCDMYDSALMPVALASKLVSLADHPSSKILQKFASSKIEN